MARTAITPQSQTVAGAAITLEAANVAGNSVSAGAANFLRVKNASGSPITVTIQTPLAINGLAVAERTVSVPATTGDRDIPLMANGRPIPEYVQTDGTILVDYSDVTTLTVAAVKVL